ncbi:MAG: aspartate kinase [Flavobacteriaceae bacterium]|nr:MAG: aspartate kinase [Flavobacteriaceae bacterium]
MNVFKFGGTSVGSVANMHMVKDIIVDGRKKVVVLSAMSGTTNTLVKIHKLSIENKLDKALSELLVLQGHYTTVLDELFEKSDRKQLVSNYVDSVFQDLRQLVSAPSSSLLYNNIVSKGELLSSFMFTHFLQSQHVKACLLPALDFMRIDKDGEPDNFYIKQNLNRLVKERVAVDIYITQGFICLDNEGEISNLKRGGSDHSATIIGAALDADEVQIWTDIDGVHNNDPRFVEGTHAISNLSFDEAAELAYFGAKILHPQTVMPARKAMIPVRLKNTMKPNSYGTLINQNASEEGIKAIAAKDAITAIKIKSARMLQAHGFLKKVFEIFEKYETSIDMITTSEIAISLTIDDTGSLEAIVVELEKFSTVEIDEQQSIICLVGNQIVKHKDTYRFFQVLQDISIRMISYGGSNNNISILVRSEDKIKTLQLLNSYVFGKVTA